MRADALCRYDAAFNRLEFIVAGDVRALTGVQNFVVPLNLVYVADCGKMEGASEAERDVFATADAAFVAQNIYLFCASAGLATVVRTLTHRPALAKAMHLKPQQRIMLAQCVGYPASTA
jgi:nitroreductase